ncbi:rhomboid family intramembrane serine protease [Virgibacillus siamensis]|uniref:rhomboid family intramembrane serine protease n=1 Tax=Virgibacillus siamensis TaxID=480071 RepID=UPI00098633DE|nr:rhomboid family intramembrane serine protease [Virgibacillus siamensis]
MFVRTERSLKEFMQFYPVVSALVIIHLALWLICDFLQLPFGVQLKAWGSGNNFFIQQGEYWRLITPIFLHAGLMHTIFNSFALVLFGPALEQMLGKYKFIAAYLFAGFAGNLATFLLGPPIYISVGASGAIYGLFGIYIFMVAFRKHLIDYSNAQIVVVIFVIGAVMTFIQPGINIYAHVFGFLGGFLIAPLVLTNALPFSPWRNKRFGKNDGVQFDPNRWKKRRIPKKLYTYAFWTFLAILVLFGLLGRIF